MPKQERRDVSNFFADKRYLQSGWATECQLEKASQIDRNDRQLSAGTTKNECCT